MLCLLLAHVQNFPTARILLETVIFISTACVCVCMFFFVLDYRYVNNLVNVKPCNENYLHAKNVMHVTRLFHFYSFLCVSVSGFIFHLMTNFK